MALEINSWLIRNPLQPAINQRITYGVSLSPRPQLNVLHHFQTTPKWINSHQNRSRNENIFSKTVRSERKTFNKLNQVRNMCQEKMINHQSMKRKKYLIMKEPHTKCLLVSCQNINNLFVSGDGSMWLVFNI